MSTCAHVTVTVVVDGVTTTYDLPEVMDFSINRETRGIAFWMRPIISDGHSFMTRTVTTERA